MVTRNPIDIGGAITVPPTTVTPAPSGVQLPKVIPSVRSLEETLQKIENAMVDIERALRYGTARPKDLLLATWNVPTVSIGGVKTEGPPTRDIYGREAIFAHLTIVQVDIAAPQLAAADSVTFRIYNRGTFSAPLELVAEFTGASQVSGMWFASFSNRRIEYTDETNLARVYMTITNAAGNSIASTFNIRVWGERYPVPPKLAP